MKKIVVASLAVSLAGPVMAQSAAEKTGVNSLIGAAPKTEDFVKEAATSDLFEIESSKLALERGDAQTKTFAQQMVMDHEKTSSELKALVSGGKVQAQLPSTMTSAQQEMLKELKGLNGDDFIKQYHSDQESAHEDAVDLFKRYGEGGDNAELKTWAASTTPALEHHLRMAEELNR
jgi:putative membrane protein